MRELRLLAAHGGEAGQEARSSLVIATRMRAGLLERVGRMEDALADRRTASRLQRERVDSGAAEWAQLVDDDGELARLLTTLGHHDEALATWTRLVEHARITGPGGLPPELAEGYACSLFAVARMDDAVQTVRDALGATPRQDPSDEAWLSLRGTLSELLGALGDNAGALSEARAVARAWEQRATPGHVHALESLCAANARVADLLSSAGEHGEAIHLLEHAIALCEGQVSQGQLQLVEQRRDLCQRRAAALAASGCKSTRLLRGPTPRQHEVGIERLSAKAWTNGER